MAPQFVIETVRDVGPTDNGAGDTLYVVEMGEDNNPPETIRFFGRAVAGPPVR